MPTEYKSVQMLDVSAPEQLVEIAIRPDGKVLWVHVDGVTVLRVSQIPRLVVGDERIHIVEED